MIVGSAGHIDHGKSTLLEALTGHPMDRPGEEQRRGITIDLHFAPLDIGGPHTVGVVDVPGHEDLVRTMVAGAAGIDVVLLVIAANEGIMPQTRDPDDLFRLPIDRALSVPGAGTVVTGTAWSGSIAVGDAARVLPMGREVRVRSIQNHGVSRDRSEAGARTAVAIAGIDRAELRRGDVLVAARDRWSPTSAIDVEVTLLPTAARPLHHRARVRLHLGTAEVLARVHLKQPVEPGATGWARLALESPAVVRGGDRFVVRSYSPVATIGGGRVIDPLPPKRTPLWLGGLAAKDDSVRLRALAERRVAGIEREEVPLLLGPTVLPLEALRLAAELREVDGWWISPVQVEAAKDALRDNLLRQQKASPLQPGIRLETLRAALNLAPWIVEAALAELLASETLVVADGLARSFDFQPHPGAGDVVLRRLVERIEKAGLTPPSLSELESEFERPDIADFLRLAARQGRLRPVERDRYYSAAALDQFRRAVREIGERGEITPAAVREQLGLSRKYLIPLLEWSDAEKLTVRRGDVRRLTAPRG